MSLFKEKLAIRELLDRYCDGVNQRDASIWGDTWSENAIWEIPHLNLKNEGKEVIINMINDGTQLCNIVTGPPTLGNTHLHFRK